MAQRELWSREWIGVFFGTLFVGLIATLFVVVTWDVLWRVHLKILAVISAPALAHLLLDHAARRQWQERRESCPFDHLGGGRS